MPVRRRLSSLLFFSLLSLLYTHRHARERERDAERRIYISAGISQPPRDIEIGRYNVRARSPGGGWLFASPYICAMYNIRFGRVARMTAGACCSLVLLHVFGNLRREGREDAVMLDETIYICC